MLGAILVLSVLLSLLPWRGAQQLDGPPELDDDPSDYANEYANRDGLAPRETAADSTRKKA